MNATRTNLREKLWRWGRGIARACRWRHDDAVIPGRIRGRSPVIRSSVLFAAFIAGFLAPAAHAQPVWQSSATAVGTAANATVNRPAGTLSGDLLVVGITLEKGSGETVTPPAGWTLIRRTNNTTDAGMATYYRVAGGSEPASYSFTLSNGSKWSIGISRITGADTSAPIHISGGLTGTASTSVTAPSVTTTVANTLVLAFYTNKQASTYTPAAGTTERYDAPNSADGLPSNMLATFVQAGAGATGNRTATASDTEFWVAQQVAIRIPVPPSTKLYFHTATTPNLGTLPAATTLSATTPNVTAAGAGTNRDMDETIGTAQVSAALTTVGQTTLQRNWFRRFLSRPLAAQTLPTGVWTIQGGASESNTASNMLLWGAVIKVWRPSTGATVATLLDDPVLGNVEPGTTETNVSRSTPSITGVAVNEGDILVVELWAENTQGSTTTHTNTIFYDGTTEGSTTSNAAFLRAPGVINFHRSLRQSAYRLFNNANSTDVGTPLAAQNTPAILGSTGAAFRLRTLLHVADIDLGISGQSFKLQFVGKGTGTCASPAGGTPAAYTDVTAATVIGYNNNATPADGAALTANAADPTHGGDTIVNQTYEELNDFTNSAAIGKGRDGKWDLSLRDNGAPGATTFCLRAVRSTGTLLDTYIVFPEITTAAGVPTPGSFNAFETSTAAAITGVIRTKVAGSAFSLDVVAIASGARQNGFTDTVIVELLGNNTLGVSLDAQNCPTSSTLVQTVAPNPTITGGRSTVNFAAVANSWRDVRVRVRWPTSPPTVTWCSTDNFAIRPANFSVAVTDTTWATAGTPRALNNVAASGGNVHKAGQPFTITVTPSPGTATNYVGSPTLSALACTLPTPCVNGTLTVGTFGGSGTRVSNDATYTEAGAFNLTLIDQTFASVDSADGTPADCSAAGQYVCHSGAPLAVGRFVPDHFDVTAVTAPVFRTFNDAACATRSFTYIGQRFGYATIPVAMIAAKNSSGGTTTNYTGALWKLTNASAPQTFANSPVMPLDTAGIAAPTVSETAGTGAGTYTANASDAIAFVRDNASPQAPFNANLSLTVSVSDATEAGASQGTITTSTPLVFNGGGSGIGFDSGNAFRYGRLRLGNANGSQLVPLPVPLETQYWNGTVFVTNDADNCTTIAINNVAMSSFTNNLAACETANTAVSAFIKGRSTLTLAAPGSGNNGSVTLTVNLGASASGNTCTTVGAAPGLATTANRPYLQGKWSGAAYDQNPASRATFGVYRGSEEVIHIREMY